MTRATEILFVDSRVADIATLLAGVRPEVEPILLSQGRPAARQMAEALAGRAGLGAVHVVAHGEPGRVHFAAGEWSAATLAGQARDLSAIGQALGEGGGLRLWSCYAGAGAAGEALVAGLGAATGADVAAASGLVGAPALGGQWALDADDGVAPPLTEAGVAAYAGVMATSTWTGTTNGTWATSTNWNGGVPSSSSDVIIANVTNEPTIIATGTISSLTLNSGATLTFAGTQTLESTTAAARARGS